MIDDSDVSGNVSRRPFSARAAFLAADFGVFGRAMFGGGSVKPIRLALIAYASALMCASAFACSGPIEHTDVARDGGSDVSTPDAGDVVHTADAAVESGAKRDAGPYVPDPGHYSGAFQINAAHTGAT